MKLTNKQAIAALAIAATLAISACSDSDDATGNSTGNSTSDTVDEATGVDFSFPDVLEIGAAVSIEAPEGPSPDFSTRRTIASGSGSPIEFGDPVIIEYNMYSWATGELVESTYTMDDPVTILAGITNGVPEYLTKSLLGRQVGDTIQIIFEQGMEDLPSYLDSDDAYVLVVDLM